ncbi:AMP-binding protein [Actinacidiphila acididurans]|uniref:AMP-binding protein n=1 Tax=Actinacidiphila acididurans TaxID=2784346 RepID=A0ABS2TU48_9ACTN|nr:AMP-binding protein [Actinacidiphila acididurans]MBM9506848.1 AMP-binding protein [Actinacidiphila acididurans]
MQHGSVHALFEVWARRTPSALAVVCGAERVTYGELDRRANRLARRLRDAELPSGGLVAVCLEPGPDALAAMLGVLKAGGAYVPLGPGVPEPQLRHVLADADPFAVVTTEALRVTASDGRRRRIVAVDREADATAGRSAEPLDVAAPDLACVLYTAGTTGPAKGVLIEHSVLLSAFEGSQVVHRPTPEDRQLVIAPMESAAFTAGWLRTLGSGGTLVLPAPEGLAHDAPAAAKDFRSAAAKAARLATAGTRTSAGAAGREPAATALHALVLAESVTVLDCDTATAADLHWYIRRNGLDLGAVRLVSVTGDVWYLDEQQALRRTLGPHMRVLNVYGPAEAAGCATFFELPDRPVTLDRPERVSLIGESFPGLHVRVLDSRGRSVVSGSIGEIAVDGPGAARGYRSADRRPGIGGWLRTGDLGRVADDGRLEYLGRKGAHADAEAVLRGHPSIEECAVAEIETAAGRRTLAAYVVLADGARSDPAGIRSYASARLPSARAPRTVVPLVSLPRTRAGRIDRRGLPLPVRSSGAGAASGGKGGPGSGSGDTRGCAPLIAGVVAAFLSAVFTDLLWPHSTDLTGVPQPEAALFLGLYVCEWLSFGLGAAFLFYGREAVARQGRSRRLSTAAHFSVVWLLVAWWPQDNFYRLASKTDWPRQAALVYGFNITLMAAAAVLVAFFVARPREWT